MKLHIWIAGAALLIATSTSATASDADRFAAAISNSERVTCKVYDADRLIACVADMDARSLDLFAGTLVEISKQKGGWHLEGRTLALRGWKWVTMNFDGYGLEHDF